MGYVGMSDYALDKMLKHLHNEAAYTPPSTYLAAYIGNPLDGGAEVTEASYARQAVSWAGVTIGTNEYTDDNSAEIAFPEAVADYGVVTHTVTFDALTSGNMLEVFELAAARNVTAGGVLKVSTGNLDSAIKRESI